MSTIHFRLLSIKQKPTHMLWINLNFHIFFLRLFFNFFSISIVNFLLLLYIFQFLPFFPNFFNLSSPFFNFFAYFLPFLLIENFSTKIHLFDNLFLKIIEKKMTRFLQHEINTLISKIHKKNIKNCGLNLNSNDDHLFPLKHDSKFKKNQDISEM